MRHRIETQGSDLYDKEVHQRLSGEAFAFAAEFASTFEQAGGDAPAPSPVSATAAAAAAAAAALSSLPTELLAAGTPKAKDKADKLPPTKRRRLAPFKPTFYASRNAKFKPPAAIRGGNLPFWFWRTVRPSARAHADASRTRVRYLKPTALGATTFKEASETLDVKDEALIHVTATEEGGVVTIAAAADAAAPSAGDAATRTPRSQLLGWNNACEETPACASHTALLGCTFCNVSFCAGCREAAGAVVDAGGVVCAECKAET